MTIKSKEWWKAAGIRAVKTIAQAAISGISTAAVISEVDWKYVLSASLIAGLLSILTSIKGLPEVDNVEIATRVDEENYD